MKILLAMSPVLVVLIGMLGLKKSAMKVAPVAMVYAIVLGMMSFGGTGTGMALSFKKGVLDGAKIVWLIWAAFTMLMMMQGSKAMDKLKTIIAGLTNDKRVHILIIAVMFGVFLEGAAGAGTPAAIAAPFLVGLGFSPMVAATAALVSNSVPVSWGGAGVTTIMGSEPVREYMTVMQASSMAGRIHMIGAIVLPFLVIFVLFGRKGFKNLVPFMLFSGISMSIVLFIFSNFVEPSITSLSTGLIAILLSVAYIKIIGIKTPDEYLYKIADSGEAHIAGDKNEMESIDMKPLVAASPYIILLILLPVVRFSFPLSTLSKYGYTVWVGAVIIASAFIGSLVVKVSIGDFGRYCLDAFKKVIPALIAMCSLLVVSDVMTKTGMMSLLATTLADIAGMMYPAMAVAIGALGSFMTGTGLGSNIMFGPMHVQAAGSLGLNPITIFAGQNVGAAIGNMICPNNVVAVATTVGILGQEGFLMKKVLPAFFAMFVLYGFLAMLYTMVIFPNYGM